MLPFLLLLLTAPAQAPQADTLKASQVQALKSLPVTRPAEEIRLQDAVAVPYQAADIVRKFTGVELKDYGGVGGLKTVNVRSLGSEHVGVFLDGVQIDNAQNMQVDLGRFSVDGISSVALYTGQKNRHLQTAKEYAAGASIYLDSERPRPSGGSGGVVRMRGGSFATVNPSVLWDKDLGRLTLRASSDFIYSSGRYSFPCFDTTLVRENGDIRALRLEAALYGQLKRGDWRLRLYSYGSERGFPGPVIRRALGFPFSAERQADQDFFLQGNWNEEWSERYATAVRFKYSDNYTHYDTHPERNPMAMPYNVKYRQRAGYLSVAQSIVLAEPWSLDYATDLQYNTLDSDVGMFVAPRRLTATGALASRLVWEKFRASASLVYLGAWDNYLNPNAGGWSRKNGFRDAWMPSASVFYSPWKWLEIDAYARRSYRLPSFNDLYYTQIGNSSLEPESASQFGGDLRVSAAAAPWTFEFRLSPYYNRVSEKIVAIPTASQFRWSMLNIGIVDITGIESKAAAVLSGDGWTAGATLRYTFQRALDHSTPGSISYGNQIPYIPLHSGGIDVDGSWRGWTVAWNTVITGGRWSLTANIPDYYLSPWSVSDVSLAKSIKLAAGIRTTELQLGCTCSNIFNCRYQIVQGYPMPGTALMLTASWRW